MTCPSRLFVWIDSIALFLSGPALKIPIQGINIPRLGINTSAMNANVRTSGEHGQSHRGSALADALFTSTQQRVLALLFGQPNRSFFVTELLALADSGRGAVQRELARLGASGLVTVTKVGNQKHYQANHDSPLYEELCSIITKTVGLRTPIQAALGPLASRVILALVYGSIAKQTDTASSDIDLLLVSDELTLEEVYAALAPVEKLLDRSVNPTLYTSNEFGRRRRTKNSFLMRILKGPHIILMGSVDDA